MTEQKTEAESRGIIWLLCYLNGKDDFYKTISDMGHALNVAGLRLVVFGPYEPDRSFTGFEYVFVPFSLVEQGNLFKHAILSRSTFGWLVDELIASEREWCGIASEVEAELAVLRATSFWERAFELMRPVVILTWGCSIPFSRLMLRLAQGKQIASYILERGLFEDTISFNLVGHFTLSNIGLRGQFIEPYSNDTELSSLWERIEKYYESPISKKYEKFNLNPDVQLSAFAGKTIVYLGAFDVNLVNSIEQYERTDRVGSFASNSAEGLRLLASCLSGICPGARLLVKPHPMRPFEIDEVYRDLDLSYQSSIDVRTLVKNCDVCVTTFTSSQVLPFIFDKPLVTLSNDFFFGREVSYAVHSQDELAPQLQAAINRHGWDEKLLNGRRLIAALFRDDLIGTNDNVPTRLKLGHLVSHLSRFIHLTPLNLKTSSERMSDFRMFEAASRELSRAPTAATLRDMLGREYWEYLYSEIRNQAVSEFQRDLEGVRHLDWLHSEKIRMEAESMESALEEAERDRDNLLLRIDYLQATESSLSQKNLALLESLTAVELTIQNFGNENRDLRAKLFTSEQSTTELMDRNSRLVTELLTKMNNAARYPATKGRLSFEERSSVLLSWIQARLYRKTLGVRHKIGRFFWKYK